MITCPHSLCSFKKKVCIGKYKRGKKERCKKYTLHRIQEISFPEFVKHSCRENNIENKYRKQIEDKATSEEIQQLTESFYIKSQIWLRLTENFPSFMVVQCGKIEGVKWAVGPSDLFLVDKHLVALKCFPHPKGIPFNLTCSMVVDIGKSHKW